MRGKSQGAATGQADAGMATISAVGAVCGLLLLGSLVFSFGEMVLARHRVASAVDLAALAAAGRANQGAAIACARAEQVVAKMSLKMTSCQVGQLDAFVEVASVTSVANGLLRIFDPVNARARAGPA